jgi:hypothetical protein
MRSPDLAFFQELCMTTMLKPKVAPYLKPQWNVGDFATNTCPRCRKLVRSRFEYRTVQLWRTRLRVPRVLVDVCTECDHMISIPPQSVEQLREAGRAK